PVTLDSPDFRPRLHNISSEIMEDSTTVQPPPLEHGQELFVRCLSERLFKTLSPDFHASKILGHPLDMATLRYG
ncbi:MAG: hypothetical protein JWO89_3271, partial [Verrucomicrobiaceae bacterium]|nr:hypothetical protein [Verrucomicrobiaceae bacterium]